MFSAYNLNSKFYFHYYLFIGVIIFGSDQEVREVMRAIRRNNATRTFSWIGSDGWSARNLVFDEYEPEVNININLIHIFIFVKKKKRIIHIMIPNRLIYENSTIYTQ